MSETIAAKAGRLLTSGSVRVVHCRGEHLEARVTGDHATYRTGFARGRWWCECPAREHRPGYVCAHIAALSLVAPTAQQQRRAVS